jgi:FkbM family methyltransferase
MTPTMIRRNGIWFVAGEEHWDAICRGSRQIADLALEHCPKRGTAVQAGGNVGLLAWILAKSFAKVVSFEPVQATYRCLEANCAGVANIEHHLAAIGEREGSISMRGVAENRGGFHVDGDGNIPMTTIDKLGLGACDIIILDVEGYEFPALKGAKQTIERFRPVIILEDKGHSRRYGVAQGEASEWLMGTFGYKIADMTPRDVVLVA